MAVDYLQDLVQNIYTNCDMSGFEDYNKGIRSLSNAVDSFNANTIKDQKRKISLLEAETKSQIRLADFQEQYALKKKRRDEDEIRRMMKTNVLWRNAIRLIGTYFGIQTIRNIIRTGSQLQLIQKSITGLTGSGQDWEFLDQQAYKFGLSLKTVSTGYKNFFSSANMAGFNKNQIQSMFADMLLGARSIGASDQQIGGALLALEQMMSKGRVSMEELRRQLGNALPGAFEIGAKAMGVTTAEFNEMVKAGISAQEFVPKFIKTFKEQYANGWKDVEQTVSVAQGRLTVAWEEFTMKFMHGEAGKALAKGINELAEFLRSPAFYEFVDVLSKIFTLLIKIFTFSIKHLKTIGILLGAGGLMMVLPQIVKYLKMLGLAFGFITSTGVINGIRILVASFWSMLAPFMALYAKILLVISALLILQDIYTAIRYPNKKSLARREWSGENTSFGASQSGLNPFAKPQNVQQKMQEYEKLKNRPMEMYSAPSAGLLKGSLFNKNETKNVNISLGDINVNSRSGNPMEIAQAVQEQLVALFTGQGLTMGIQEMVV